MLCITINITFHVLKNICNTCDKNGLCMCNVGNSNICYTYVTHEYMFTCVYTEMFNICFLNSCSTCIEKSHMIHMSYTYV